MIKMKLFWCVHNLGDHFYKRNEAIALKDQMISALPDVRIEKLTNDDQFMVLACDGIW